VPSAERRAPSAEQSLNLSTTTIHPIWSIFITVESLTSCARIASIN